MILAIDMGNTNIVIGGIDDQRTYFLERITTNRFKTDLEYAINVKISWKSTECPRPTSREPSSPPWFLP